MELEHFFQCLLFQTVVQGSVSRTFSLTPGAGPGTVESRFSLVLWGQKLPESPGVFPHL